MKKLAHLRSVTLGLAALTALAADSKNPPANPDPYPLTTCLVADEPLGSMGDAVVYTHKEPGKPDRVVRFCCEGCIEDFRANPEKFLKKLDAAAAKKKSEAANKKS